MHPPCVMMSTARVGWLDGQRWHLPACIVNSSSVELQLPSVSWKLPSKGMLTPQTLTLLVLDAESCVWFMPGRTLPQMPA